MFRLALLGLTEDLHAFITCVLGQTYNFCLIFLIPTGGRVNGLYQHLEGLQGFLFRYRVGRLEDLWEADENDEGIWDA